MPARATLSATPSVRTRALVRWIVVGVIVYLSFLIINLPANVLFTQLNKRGIQASAISGTLWHGRASNVQAGVLKLGNAEWQLRFLPLLSGKLAADVKLTPSKGFAQGRVAWSMSGALSFNDLSASLPLESIVGAGGLPGGWIGTAQAKLDDLVLKDNWPVAAQGTIDIVDLTGPTNQPANIGAYRLSFGGDSSSKDGTLIGNLQDMTGAAISVTGTLKLAPGHNYEMDTMVAARANTPAAISQGMQILGEPDAQGRRPFSVSGTL